MGQKAKVIGMLVVLLAFCGCERKVSPPPHISVNELDSDSYTSITITYNYHYRDQNGPTYVVLDTPEAIAAYKKQVEWLLGRLDEAERRMNIHEPETETPVQP